MGERTWSLMVLSVHDQRGNGRLQELERALMAVRGRKEEEEGGEVANGRAQAVRE